MACNRRTSNWLYGLALSSGLALSGGLLGFVSPAAQAQTVSPNSATAIDPLQDFRTDTSNDPFSARGNNSTGVFNLIHQAMQGSFGVNQGAVFSEQRESITDAAAEFRKKQQLMLRSPQGLPNSPTPAVVPGSAIGQPSAPAIVPSPTPSAP